MEPNQRILVVDDNEAVREDISRLLGSAEDPARSAVEDLAAMMFADDTAKSPGARLDYEIACASQGREALEMTRIARQSGRPFAMAFVDMRMPPGWDGLTTVKHLWQTDPELEVVICSAYSDYEWADVVTELGETDQLLFLKKPFDSVAVEQLARALILKWNRRYLADAERTRLAARLEACADEARGTDPAQTRLIHAHLCASDEWTLPSGPSTLGLAMAGRSLLSPGYSGDWWLCRELRDGRALVALGTTPGQGVEAAMSAATLTGSIAALAEYADAPTTDDFLDTLARMARTAGSRPLNTSGVVAIFDREKRVMRCAGVGTQAPLLVRGQGTSQDIHALSSDGDQLGSRAARWPEESQPVRPGDRVLFYSDGVLRRHSERDEPFGVERLRALLANARVPDRHLIDRHRTDSHLIGARPAGWLRDHVLDSIHSFGGGRTASEDMSVVACCVLDL